MAASDGRGGGCKYRRGMVKSIVLSFNGTSQHGSISHETNVRRLYQALGHNDAQLCRCDGGVGSENFKPSKILGGAFGVGARVLLRVGEREQIRELTAGKGISGAAGGPLWAGKRRAHGPRPGGDALAPDFASLHAHLARATDHD